MSPASLTRRALVVGGGAALNILRGTLAIVTGDAEFIAASR